MEDIRVQVLGFFDADPNQFDVIFAANATAAIKLVADCLRDHPGGFWYGYHQNSHTSLVGVREVAIAGHTCFEAAELEAWLDGKAALSIASAETVRLIAYPAQSNLDGHRLPPDWSARIREKSRKSEQNIFTLLDAAALLSTSSLDLSDPSKAPDFTVLSFQKIFGFPDLGALIVRKESDHTLRQRKYFGGGTVDAVSCTDEQWHVKKEGPLHQQLEDGTLPFHSIIALDTAIRVQQRLFGSQQQISIQTSYLSHRLYSCLSSLYHGNGKAVCEIYKHPTSSYLDSRTQGPIIAFNLRNDRGKWISLAEVEKLATIKQIHLRSGGLCNPGGTASYLSLTTQQLKHNYLKGQRCDGESETLETTLTGALRVSLGATTTIQDITALVAFIEEFFVCPEPRVFNKSQRTTSPPNFYVEALTVFPIKSCAGWQIPNNITWDIRTEGLVWDREWCLVHQGNHTSLSQKKYPKMALIRPELDLAKGILRIRYNSSLPPSIPSEISVPLYTTSEDYRHLPSKTTSPVYRVCGDSVEVDVYTSSEITDFFTRALDIPCYLARFPPDGVDKSMRHSKPHLLPKISGNRRKALQTVHSPSPHRILLSNESPILIISRSSLNRLNESIKSKSPAGKAASAQVFRANIEIAEDSRYSPGLEQPFIEDGWQKMVIEHYDNDIGVPDDVSFETVLDVLGPCRRCQMICVDQRTGEKDEEPFVTLAKTRRIQGQVNFGVHAGLDTVHGAIGKVQVGDRILGRLSCA